MNDFKDDTFISGFAGLLIKMGRNESDPGRFEKIFSATLGDGGAGCGVH